MTEWLYRCPLCDRAYSRRALPGVAPGKLAMRCPTTGKMLFLRPIQARRARSSA